MYILKGYQYCFFYLVSLKYAVDQLKKLHTIYIYIYLYMYIECP